MEKLFLGRASLVGDTIMFLPVLTFFKKLIPNSYIIFPIARKCSQAAMLYIQQKDIDKIHILEEWESLGSNDRKLMLDCKHVTNPFPQHPSCPGLIVGIDNFWYNYFDCVTETARMAGIHQDDFNRILSIEEQNPRLSQWFEVKKEPKSILIHARAGYNNEQTRNPSTKYWLELVPKIKKMGYKVYHAGVESEEDIGATRITQLSLFEQIKVALSCDLVIGNDSGFNWTIGAFGHPMISLITNHAPQHENNLFAFAPKNCKNNNINLFAKGGCDNISQDLVLESIKQLCS